MAAAALAALHSFGFLHGVHPPEHKELTAHLPVRRLPFPREVVLPVRQHAGKPARPTVEPGDEVHRGDLIAAADGWVSAPVHASASGTVSAVELWPHPDGGTDLAIRIAVARYSTHLPQPRLVPEWSTLGKDAVVRAVQDAGVVGLGGAAFPTHVKLAPPPDVAIHTLIINGAECEPYLTTDHRIMVEHPDRVFFGVRIMLQTTGAQRAIIGVERNKPDAIEALRAAAPPDLPVTVLPLTVKYPQGAEKMLIKSVLDTEVPSGKLPASVGVIVQNVGSAASIAEVFETGLPLIERIVTVSGRGVRKPANLLVPVGTRLRDLLDACGGLTEDAAEILFGGPMMGLPQANIDVPIMKGTTGVVVLSRDEVRGARSYPCIHCGFCLEACPMFLNPSLLGELARAGRVEDMAAEHLADCMLCGSCSYVCPSNIPLAQQFALSKAALRRKASPAPAPAPAAALAAPAPASGPAPVIPAAPPAKAGVP